MRRWAFACLAFVSLAVPTAGGEAERPGAVVLRGRAQGTTYSIKFWARGDRGASRDAVEKAVAQTLERIDREMSTYRPDSELSRFNRAGAGEWFSVSAETARVVRASLDFHAATGGALDVTVAPLVRLWHFGPPGGEPASGALRTPTEAQLRAAREHVGAERLQVRRQPPALRKQVDGLEVDLSGIAQGYTVDVLVERLAKLGVRDALVELGGEVRATGARADGSAWRIGVKSPAAGNQRLARVVALRDLALTTAGDERNIVADDGRRYSHIIDPRTGAALPFRGASVTVLATTALEADALDTALMVLGPDAGYAWCEEHDVAALFQTCGPDGGEAVERATPRFVQLAGAE